MKTKLTTKNCQSKANFGFTLLELVISMALIAILTSSAMQIARFSDTQKNLTLATDELRAVIHSAQSSSLSIPNEQDRHVCGFGVYFGDPATALVKTQYETFYTYVAPADFALDPNACSQAEYLKKGATNHTTIEKKALPKEVELGPAIADTTIFFKVPYGDPYDENGVPLDPANPDKEFKLFKKGSTTYKSVSLSASGKVD